MQTLYYKIRDFFVLHKSSFIIALVVFVLTFHYMPYFVDKTFDGNFDGGIQNKLVWSIKGECHFVRPIGKNETILVRVKDCDRSEYTTRPGKEKHDSK
jgi:hypothetical protein